MHISKVTGLPLLLIDELQSCFHNGNVFVQIVGRFSHIFRSENNLCRWRRSFCARPAVPSAHHDMMRAVVLTAVTQLGALQASAFSDQGNFLNERVT